MQIIVKASWKKKVRDFGDVKVFKFKDFYDPELKKPEIEPTPRRYRLIELEE
jgi:hypothetical protein